jgi:adenylosuccinate synthase
MTNTILIGAQWGDEGKGKIIDILTEEADWIVRYQGGNNAGHTIEIGAEKYVLHLIPSGILRPGKRCVIGHGVVIQPLALLDEIRELAGRGVAVDGRLFVSDRAHVVLPYHRALDESREQHPAGGDRLGTTRRGIGPAYADKANRVGLRMGDLLQPELADRLNERIREKNRLLAGEGTAPLEAEEIIAAYQRAARELRPYVADTVTLLNQAAARGERILFEGAQGTMLDLDCGSYPFVTSSSTTAGGACTGTGVPPKRIDRVVGVVKAYTTRVGEGPFPTELTDEIGAQLRETGREFGATTGRPRRCGWFDAVVARYAAMVNGIDCWAVTKLDVLDRLETIRIGVAYECQGRRLDTVPATAGALAACRPVYEDWPGWRESTQEITRFEALPEKARAYLRRLVELTGVPIGLLSLGPRRDSTITLDLP